MAAVHEITRVSKADEGSYSCIAINSAGTTEERLMLRVELDNNIGPTRGDIASGGGDAYGVIWNFCLVSSFEMRNIVLKKFYVISNRDIRTNRKTGEDRTILITVDRMTEEVLTVPIMKGHNPTTDIEALTIPNPSDRTKIEDRIIRKTEEVLTIPNIKGHRINRKISDVRDLLILILLLTMLTLSLSAEERKSDAELKVRSCLLLESKKFLLFLLTEQSFLSFPDLGPGEFLDWIRAGNAPLPAGSRVENGTLYIENVQSDYAGEYQCIGLNNLGQVLFTAKANLAVVGE